MLKYRLIFGTLMTIFFISVVLWGGWIDGSVTVSRADDTQVQGTIFCILIALLIIPAQLEFSKLAAARGLTVFPIVTIPASILLATTWYWPQMFCVAPHLYLSLVLGFSLLLFFLFHNSRYGTSGVMANCGVNLFSIVYLGLLSGFVLAVRIDFGLWPLLMFVFTVKCSDIGAYAFGRLFGRHKFSPLISPGKTWEGMAGAVLVAVIVAIVLAVSCGIMAWWLAAIFGFCFAFIGQLGDLAESMIKRDAEQKDSANNVPGFGGVLDIIDSPLAAAVFAYVFFYVWFSIGANSWK